MSYFNKKMMKPSWFTSLLLAAVFVPAICLAGITGDVPSCYQANKLASPPEADKELFVLIDQTTVFDTKLKNSIRENVGRVIKPGTSYVIADFSSYSQGRYLEILSAGTLEKPLPESKRNDTSVKLLKNFDACMMGQAKFGLKTAASALNKTLAGSSSDLAKSDVLASLVEISARVKKSVAKEKIVLIASDMLENSSITSFYSKKAVRQIKPETELGLAETNNLMADFGGAKVYVLGAGLLAEDINQPKGVYRSPQTMQALLKFWQNWFKNSNAELVEFGQPALLNPLK